MRTVYLNIVINAVGVFLNQKIGDGELDLAIVGNLNGPDALSIVGVGVGVVGGDDDTTFISQHTTAARVNC